MYVQKRGERGTIDVEGVVIHHNLRFIPGSLT